MKKKDTETQKNLVCTYRGIISLLGRCLNAEPEMESGTSWSAGNNITFGPEHPTSSIKNMNILIM